MQNHEGKGSYFREGINALEQTHSSARGVNTISQIPFLFCVFVLSV